jgi:CheY-like chemotaxis protein
VKALVVMPANIEALELCDGLSAQGLEVAHAPSGLYALTLFERERPDLIVCVDDIVDMTGRELLEILNEDGGDQIAFILMTAHGANNLPPNAIVVPPEALVVELLERAGMLEVEDAPDASPPEVAQEVAISAPSENARVDALKEDDASEVLARPKEHTTGQFKFENQGFIHLMHWLSRLTEFARVELRCGPSVGQIYFVHGLLTHAEFGRQRGEDAIRTLFLAASDHQGGSFTLEPIDVTTAANLPQSISRPVAQIVLTWSA